MSQNLYLSNPIRVLRLIPVLDFGGVESRFALQAAQWRSQTIQVEYCTFWKDGAAAGRLRDLGATVHVLGEDPSVRNPKATRALYQLVRKNKYDIVHSSIGEANFHNMLIGIATPWKTIIEEAGIPSRRVRNRLIHGLLYRACDSIVAVSQASADYLTAREWAPRSRVKVIPNAIRPEFFDGPQSTRGVSTLKTFRAVGRLTAVKNYAMLIRAFAQARQQAPNIRLEIVGEGEDRQQLESLIHELNASSFIMLRGFISDIVALHKDTDFFLMPSLSEGFGLAAAEPMAMGVPGLGSTVGGLFTVFGDLADEWLLPAKDESAWARRIQRLAQSDAQTYHQWAAQFAAEAQRFSPDRYIRDLEALYRDVLV